MAVRVTYNLEKKKPDTFFNADKWDFSFEEKVLRIKKENLVMAEILSFNVLKVECVKA